MDFTSAFLNINRLDTKQFRYDYTFNSGNISIIANTESEQFQIFVIITIDELQICRQLNLYLQDDNYQFNSYWNTEYFSKIYPIIAVDGKLDTFWLDMINRLSNLTDIELERINQATYENIIHQATTDSQDTHFLSHLRKSNMSKKQFEKIARLYGEKVAYKVQSLGCTLVFSSDPLKSHTIVIDDLVIK